MLLWCSLTQGAQMRGGPCAPSTPSAALPGARCCSFLYHKGSKRRASFAVLFQSLACSFSGSQPVHLQSSLVLLLPCRNGGVDAGIGVAGSLRPHFRLPVCVPGLVLCPTQEQLLKSCSFGGDACASWSKSQWQGLCCRWESLAGDVSPMAIG